MKIKIFSSRSGKGNELADILSHKLPEIIISLVNDINEDLIDIDVIFPGDYNYGQLFFYLYEKNTDLIIFDASIEDDGGEIQLGENYACAPHAPYMNDNVLVVSRTGLPLNFIPHTTNVLPFGEDYIKEGDDIKFIRSYDNEKDILPWVVKQIRMRHVEGKLLRGTQPNYRSFCNPVKKDPNLFIHDGSRVAFISYRSYYNAPNKCGQCSVQDLEQYILNYHKEHAPNERWRVLYYPPGSLSQDCPTEDLRWSLMTFVENVFIHVDEVWIFNSEKDDLYSYWDSWFTQGEFISLMIINQGLHDKLPKMFLFNPHDKSAKVLHEIPYLSDEARQELGAITANSDTLWGDRAALKKIIWTFEHKNEFSLMKRMKLAINEFVSRNIVKLFCNKVASHSEMQKLHAYDSSFLTSRIFSCKRCSTRGNSMEDVNNESFISDFIHIGDVSEPWLSYNKKRGIFVVNNEDFQKCVKRGYVQCPNCLSKIYIKHAPDQSFFLWQRYIPNNPYGDSLIERVEAYNVVN